MERAANNIMKFTKLQLAAIFKLGFLMVAADGEFNQSEEKLLTTWMAKLSVDSGINDTEAIGEFAKNMQYAEVVPVILPMTTEQKNVVAAAIGSIMLIDGTIDSGEKRLFDTTCKMCGLPILTNAQCRELFSM